jgi:hypothetical protein
LLFITGTTPDELRSKKNMTKVRKKAMGSYLEKGKRPREEELSEAQRRGREGSASTCSRSNFDKEETRSRSTALATWREEDQRRSAAREDTPTDSTYTYVRSDMTPEPHPFDVFLAGPPMVPPMRSDVALPYDHYTPGPFESIGKPLDPFSTMYQASHPRVSVEELKWYCSRSFGTKAMGLHWVTIMVKSPHAFLSTLCIASAHHDAIHERAIESVQTLALRQEVMHLISQSLVNPQSRVDDYNIVALTQLIASELISGHESALTYHESGVEAMINQRGGLQELGGNGHIASTVSWVSLESAVLRETAPSALYTLCPPPPSAITHPSNAPVPESPLYCPRGDFDTVKRSTRCSPRTFDLLKDVRMLLDLFLHETERSRANALSLKNIHKKLATQYPPALELNTARGAALTPNEWRYEAVRIASVITAVAVTQRIPLSEALSHTAAAESEHLRPPATTVDDHGIELSPSSTASPSTMDASPLYPTPSPTYPLHQQTNPFVGLPTTTPLTTPTSHPSSAPTTSSTPSSTSTIALLSHLKHALTSSDLSDVWSDMAGVLLWLALTAATASRATSTSTSPTTSDDDEAAKLRKWFRALAVRVSIVLCFEHPEAVQRALLRAVEVVRVLKMESGGRERGKGKKRKA